jgi:predicted transcriptional regulator
MAEVRQKPRSRCRLYADILRVIRQSKNVKITHLLHSVNVPYDRLVSYMADMEEQGLIEKSGDGNTSYTITKKGQKYLDEFRKVDEFSRLFGVEI